MLIIYHPGFSDLNCGGIRGWTKLWTVDRGRCSTAQQRKDRGSNITNHDASFMLLILLLLIDASNSARFALSLQRQKM
jgi:hypothetical protein